MKSQEPKVNKIDEIKLIDSLDTKRREELVPVVRKFPFQSNKYYLSLIDWSDPGDPIKRIIIPDRRELDMGGDLDPSDEKAYTVLKGVEHKYDSTVLLIMCSNCEGICRYCFRKRVFMDSHEECLEDIPAMLDYIRNHSEVTNVLLTGGDPLTLPIERLDRVISSLREIEHVQIIRIGTKMPVFNPYKILGNTALMKMIAENSLPDKKIYIMTHFMHPREITPVALKGITALQKAGAIVNNQCPIIRGVNDDPQTLIDLLSNLSWAGIIPYYLFQCRPTLGNSDYAVPIEEGYQIVEQAKGGLSGLAKRTRFVMSHSTGKLEIAALTDKEIIFKYHRAFRNTDSGRILKFKRNPQACWLDDYITSQ